ncbi:MAG: response regulator, partial [Kiritimatiellae bacterium]|nr:response regulator [Kiritimatiellia bacterium]
PGAAILLVDDDPGILQAAAILFRVMGFTPLTATSLEDAVTAFNANAARIRAAVLDANVGDGTSAPLLDAIKGSVPTLPCIIASGYSEQKTATVFAGHRYDAFLGKPYTRSELAGILARFSLVS